MTRSAPSSVARRSSASGAIFTGVLVLAVALAALDHLFHLLVFSRGQDLGERRIPALLDALFLLLCRGEPVAGSLVVLVLLERGLSGLHVLPHAAHFGVK